MLSCKDMTKYSTEYLEGRLSLWKRLMYQLHKWVCPPCADYEEQISHTARTLRLLQEHGEDEEEEPEVPGDLLERIAAAQRAASSGPEES